MAEWLKAAVLKTVDGETRPGVRIPLPPPENYLFHRWRAHTSKTPPVQQPNKMRDVTVKGSGSGKSPKSQGPKEAW